MSYENELKLEGEIYSLESKLEKLQQQVKEYEKALELSRTMLKYYDESYNWLDVIETDKDIYPEYMIHQDLKKMVEVLAKYKGSNL